MVATIAQSWSGTSTIQYRGETFRSVSPETTWARIRPAMDAVGITRVADVTGLDDLGIHTHVAYRPVGRTLAVSVGTGLSATQSRVSAAMESIETWHAENLAPPATCARPAELDLPYRIRDLALAPRSPVNESTVLGWAAATGILTGRSTFIPIDSLLLDARTRNGPSDITRLLFSRTSNGLASGNTEGEAILHGLLETVERDCWAEMLSSPTGDRRVIDPASTDNAVCAFVLRALEDSESIIWLYDITNQVGIPAYTASIWSESVPMIFGGAGCHLDPGVAVGRAISEAAQSRLVAVAGARDDIGDSAYRRPHLAYPRPARPAPAQMRSMDRLAYRVRDIDIMIRQVAQAVWDHTGCEPLVVDLSQPDIGVPVTKVYAPGLRMYDHQQMTTSGMPAEGSAATRNGA